MRVEAKVSMGERVLAENTTLHEVYPHVELNVSSFKILMEDPVWMKQFQRGGDFNIILQLTPSGTLDLKIIAVQKDDMDESEFKNRLEDAKKSEIKEIESRHDRLIEDAKAERERLLTDAARAQAEFEAREKQTKANIPLVNNAPSVNEKDIEDQKKKIEEKRNEKDGNLTLTMDSKPVTPSSPPVVSPTKFTPGPAPVVKK